MSLGSEADSSMRPEEMSDREKFFWCLRLFLRLSLGLESSGAASGWSLRISSSSDSLEKRLEVVRAGIVGLGVTGAERFRVRCANEPIFIPTAQLAQSNQNVYRYLVASGGSPNK